MHAQAVVARTPAHFVAIDAALKPASERKVCDQNVQLDLWVAGKISCTAERLCVQSVESKLA
eukprot:2723276-Pleurochrysis_carterae.AAC.1